MLASHRCFLFAGLLLFGVVELTRATDKIIKNKWIKTGALDRWGQGQRLRENPENACNDEVQPSQCDCTSGDMDITADQQRLALVFYRKLVQTMFARDALRKDEQTDAYYVSDLSMKITSYQLNQLLNEASSASMINAVLSEVLVQSDNIRQQARVKEERCERLYHFLVDFFESKTLHNLLPVVLLIGFCVIVRKISRLMRMHPLIVVVLLIMSITFCNKWKECNEKLAKQSLENLDLDQTQTQTRSTSTLSRTWQYVFGGRSTNKGSSSTPICDPLQVLVEATVSVQAVYFRSIGKEYINTYEELTKGVGWMERIVIGVLLLGLAYIMLTTLLSVGIRSSFETVGHTITHSIRSFGTSAADGNVPSVSGAPQPVVPPMPAFNLNIHIGESAATRLLSTNADILRIENQHIEVVPEDEVIVPAINGSDSNEGSGTNGKSTITLDPIEETPGEVTMPEKKLDEEQLIQF